MKIEEIAELVGELAVLPFFPSEPAARAAIIRLIGEMTNNDDEIRWLIRRMTSGIYSEWPGISELRGCFCNSHKPRDGINAYSNVYPNGFPPDPTLKLKRVEAPVTLELPPGKVTADETLQASFDIAVQVNALTRSDRFSAKATPEEIAAAPPWLRRLEGYEDPPGTPPSEPPRNAKGLCSRCGGPGVLSDGGYCSCPMGRDLAAVSPAFVKESS